MRRLFHRHIRKTLAQNVPPVLQEANFAFDKGEYGHAGELFERLAQKASARGAPRAPIFYLQAGRARIFAGQPLLGMPSLKRGLELLAQDGQWTRLDRLGRRLVTELHERGLHQEASEIENWLMSVLSSTPPAAASAGGGRLPTHCPACGAPVHSDEVEWLGDVTAACAYCGSPLPA